MRNLWEKLSPKNKQAVVLISSIALILGVVVFFTPSDDNNRRSTPAGNNIRSVLTDVNSRDLSIDAMSADLQFAMREIRRLENENTRALEELEKKAANEALRKDREIARLNELIVVTNDRLREAETRPQRGTVDAGVESKPTATPSDSQTLQGKSPTELFEGAALPGRPVPASDDNRRPGEQAASRTLVIASVTGPAIPDDDHTDRQPVFLPAGTMISGALLNGIDAPTGRGARNDPFPATVRIQKEAILPNHYRADVRECFVLVSGYGDLSTERAFLRAETISCIKDNDEVIETGLQAYVVGEDGKAGMRGRLVSKEGQMIARAMLAGFFGGAAEALDVQRVPTYSLGTTGQSQFERNQWSSDLAQGAGARGASEALSKISDYYMELADQIFPVIEIDATRRVDILLTKGTTLNVTANNSDYSPLAQK